jgi:hypothetical protein
MFQTVGSVGSVGSIGSVGSVGSVGSGRGDRRGRSDNAVDYWDEWIHAIRQQDIPYLTELIRVSRVKPQYEHLPPNRPPPALGETSFSSPERQPHDDDHSIVSAAASYSARSPHSNRFSALSTPDIDGFDGADGSESVISAITQESSMGHSHRRGGGHHGGHGGHSFGNEGLHLSRLISASDASVTPLPPPPPGMGSVVSQSAAALPHQWRYLRIQAICQVAELLKAEAESTRPVKWLDKATLWMKAYDLINDCLIDIDPWKAALVHAQVNGDENLLNNHHRGALESLFNGVGIVHDHLSRGKESALQRMHTRKNILLDNLQPQWQSRDEAKARMGDRWNRNPNPKNDFSRRRIENEIELKDLTAAIDCMEGLRLHDLSR